MSVCNILWFLSNKILDMVKRDNILISTDSRENQLANKTKQICMRISFVLLCLLQYGCPKESPPRMSKL